MATEAGTFLPGLLAAQMAAAVTPEWGTPGCRPSVLGWGSLRLSNHPAVWGAAFLLGRCPARASCPACTFPQLESP